MKLRKLTSKEIRKFTSRKGAQSMVVSNFLLALPADSEIAVRKLNHERALYKWNTATFIAILDGIDLAREAHSQNMDQEKKNMKWCKLERDPAWEGWKLSLTQISTRLVLYITNQQKKELKEELQQNVE